MTSGRPIPCKVYRNGGGIGVHLVREIVKDLDWHVGDTVAVRVVGDKLIIERVQLERLAIVRTGEPQNNAGSLFG